MTRAADITRTTGETDIRLGLALDGTGAGTRTTGVGFFDHMLDLLARHGRLDLDVDVRGDLDTGVAPHGRGHGLVLGQALTEALGDRRGITRYGHAVVPMDEARASCAMDISGRPLPCGRASRSRPASPAGSSTSSPRSSCARSPARAADAAHHAGAGTNAHHLIEGAFKAFARALRVRVEIDPTETGVPSTEGHA